MEMPQNLENGFGMIFFDTHIHLQDMPSSSSQALKAAGVGRCVCVSAQESDWSAVGSLAASLPDLIVPAFGLHPWYAVDAASGWVERLEQNLKKYPRALVGECGFDRLKTQNFDIQAQIFDIQIKLAKKYRRTLLIHAVKAWEWLEPYWQKLPAKFVFHSFNGRPEHLKNIFKYNGYIAVNKSILKNKTAVEILKTVPRDRFLLETDAPYQSNPADLPFLCRQIAQIRGEDCQELAEALYQNGMEMIKND